MSSDRPIEVAIVGGGCAAITAAFELSRPEHRGRYHVTVYQLGWRLGGKAASGRGPNGRIEEHGLHIWLGFYENAFRLIRDCYEELDRDPARHRYASWTDVFFGNSLVGITEANGDGWDAWTTYFPPSPGMPGDPLEHGNPLTLTHCALRAIDLLRKLIVGLDKAREQPTELAADPQPRDVIARLTRMVSLGILTSAAAVVEALAVFQVVLRALPSYPHNLVLRFVETLAASIRSRYERLIASDPGIARRWEIIDLVVAILLGAVRHKLFLDERGLDALNDYECRDWLRSNGASQRALDSAFVRGLYDLALAYEDGDPSRPGLAAGQALRGSLRMFFTYRGSLFWKLRGSMGDLVFGPLYEVLEQRGVTFRFFHKLRNVRLAQDPGDPHPHVARLEFDVQATPAGGEYQPMVDVHGTPSWPARPLYDQLVDGARLRDAEWNPESHWDHRCVDTRTLQVTRDFDFVVLGVSVAEIPNVCSEILARDPRWRSMTAHVKTVATQAFQIWLNEDLRSLGWFEEPATLAGFKKPFDTWSDMSHIVAEEDWPDEPRSVAYFCGVLADPPGWIGPDDGYPQQRRAEVKHNAIEFLRTDIRHLWPASGDGEFRWSALHADHGSGEERFDAQYWTANVNPTDRYVLALPGSLQYRLSPLDNTYDNMTIAGDWTDCGFNEGCVEAAVMSGRLAAHAISSSPPLEDIVGYDYP